MTALTLLTPALRSGRLALALTGPLALAALLAGCNPQTLTPTRASAPPPAAAPAGGAPRALTLLDAPGGPASSAAPPASAVAAPAEPAAVAPASAAPPPAPPVMPFEEAILYAADKLFGNANVAPAAAPLRGGEQRFPVVIDPLIDGNSGFQTTATQTMEKRISQFVREKYPQYEVQPFNSAALSRGPLLFIGTFTAVNMDGTNKPGRDWHRVCLALLDMRSGKIVSKGFAKAAMEGVDMTPTAFYLDTPAWAPDPATTGYVKTCQGTKAGDAINPAYWDRIIAAAMINDAVQAYNDGRYADALDLYRGVAHQPGGDQLRVYQGMYLAASKLGKRDEAAEAFARIVDFGLAQKQLGVKFLFRPGSTLFPLEPQISGPYSMWLSLISQRAGQRTACLKVSGHTSRTGPEPMNERLSLMRAQTIKRRLEEAAPALRDRIAAEGMGSAQNISGLGTDDARDALDRRVEFNVSDCPGKLS